MGDTSTRAVAIVHEFIGGGCSLGEALEAISALATAALGADMAGLTLMTDAGRPSTVVYTDRMVPEIDQAQYDTDRGPCLEAFRQRRTVHVADVADEQRWPEFADAAKRHGMRTSLSIPLIVGGRGIGALNFFGGETGRFDDHATERGTIFTRHAAIIAAYYDRAEEADNLQRAIQSRAEIDQAKGIIMATTGGGADHAFELLREQSQRENRKLRDIAGEIVARQQRHQLRGMQPTT